MMNLTHLFRLRHAVLLGAIACLAATSMGCSRPSASLDIAGTWIQETGTGLPGDSVRWRFGSSGTFSQAAILFGETNALVAGTYKIRPPKPEYASIPGQIVECSSPQWEFPKLLRLPPHSNTLLIAVNCDDDSLSGGRPGCWVRKEGAAPPTLETSPEETMYGGLVVATKQNKNSVSLLLDTKVHGKQVECPVIDDEAARKLGDPKKLEGKRIEVKGKPEEHWRTVFLFIEDPEQMKVLK